MSDRQFIHKYLPPTAAGAPILVLLHGTGGNENDLIPLGQQLAPEAGILSVRGRVLEHGMPRFFKRFAEGVFDLEDLRLQTDALADFLQSAKKQYGVEDRAFIAVGYSNGANIASSLLFTHPGVIDKAILLRAMVPFESAKAPQLTGLPVLIAAGRRDPIAQQSETARLVELFQSGGANVSVYWHLGGHELSGGDLQAAKNWLAA